jgi:hypothetical protein
MNSIPEQYRMPAIAGGILLLALIVAFTANQKNSSSATPSTTTTVTTTTAATPTTTKPAAAPIKKPAPKPTTNTAPQTVTNPAQLGRAPTIVSDQLKLSILVSSYGADLAWTPSYVKDIKGYVIVKSTTDSNPYYPKEAWATFLNANTGYYQWQDRNIEKGKLTYYRVCMLLADDSVTCGNVATALKP